jgi:hypothetical protein
MNQRIVIGVICVALGSILSASSGVVNFMIIGEINRKRPATNPHAYFGFFTLWRVIQIYKEYKESYPEGRLVTYTLTLAGFAMMCWLVLAVLIGTS